MQDIVILILVAVGAIVGLWKGWLSSLVHVALFALAFVVINFMVKDNLVNYVRYDLLLQIYPEGISVTIEDYTIRITTIEDLFLVLQNFSPDLDATYLLEVGLLTVEVIYFIIATLISEVVAFVGSTVLSIVFLIIPKKIRKGGIIGRILGAILSAASAIVVWTLISMSLGQLVVVANDIVPELEGAEFLAGNYETVKTVVDYANQILNPNNSMIMSSIYNMLIGMGINPFNYFSFEYHDELINLQSCYSSLIDFIIEMIESISSANQAGSEGSEGEVTNEAVNSLVNICQLQFGFN